MTKRKASKSSSKSSSWFQDLKPILSSSSTRKSSQKKSRSSKRSSSKGSVKKSPQKKTKKQVAKNRPRQDGRFVPSTSVIAEALGHTVPALHERMRVMKNLARVLHPNVPPVNPHIPTIDMTDPEVSANRAWARLNPAQNSLREVIRPPIVPPRYIPRPIPGLSLYTDNIPFLPYPASLRESLLGPLPRHSLSSDSI